MTVPRSTADQYEREANRTTTQVRRTNTTTPRPVTPVRRTTPMPDIETIRAYGSVRNADAGQAAATAARGMLPANYADPFNGQTPWDLGQALLTNPTVPTSPSGPSGPGGGGGAPAVDPAALQAAYQTLLGQQFNAAPYDPTAMLAAYSDDPINQTYDQQSGTVNTNMAAGVSRLGGINEQLNARAGVARQGVATSFDQSRAALDQIRQQGMAATAQNQGGVNDVLSKFGAGQVQGPTNDLTSLMSGLQGVQQNVRGMYDQSLADRGEAYAGLNADVSQGMTREATGLQQGIAGQRAAALAAQAQQRAKITADMALAQSQAQAAWDQRQAEVRLQAAQLGIDLGV